MRSKITISKDVIDISNAIGINSKIESEYLPVDKYFLDRFLPKILKLDPIEFVLFNSELVNPTYSIQLFICLPEIWEKLDLSDLEVILDNFTNSFSYFVLIQFSYKYLEIDILEMIIEHSRTANNYLSVKEYLFNQSNVIIKGDDDRRELEEGVEQEFFRYDANRWSYIRQKFLLDKRARPAIQDYNYLKEYLSVILK